ncbi:MAG: bifunctional riboflavin kinase/FAD synthetase [Spirosomaceae bacterium]|nr:bifunctional riboflavin kinase/FAD synthetase [Spirosomataceae bacterium]
MKVYHKLSEFTALSHAVVTSGTFDGVHIGHQKILKSLNEIAAKKGGESVVLTFWPHPRMVVSRDSQQLKLITTIEEKIALIEKLGVQHLLVVPFTREFSELSAEKYVQEILINTIGTKTLVIGYDHRFGKNREGGFDYLEKNSNRFGISLEEIPRQEIEDLTISSTKVRNALTDGNVDLASNLLGRNYEFTGIVAKGRQLGRQLGFPTANVQVKENYKLIPANGVYAVRANVREVVYNGIMNIGNRPTVEGVGRTQEVHIFDFNSDIYGELITVEIVSFIRNEVKFSSITELKNQIEVDSSSAKALLP